MSNKDTRADVCVLGLGYVGLPTACLLAASGLQVIGVDTNAKVIEALKEGRTLLREGSLATLVIEAHRSGQLTPSREPREADVYLICVPTAIHADGSADLRAVEAATRAIVPLLQPGDLVILESTGPIGTTRDLVGRLIRDGGLQPGRDVYLCYCPERITPGNSREELVRNARILGGVTPQSAERAKALYARFCKGDLTVTDDRTAEMAKLMENTYRAVNIAAANSFACIAEDAGIDVWEAIALANRHPRVAIHEPGPGVGGHCVPLAPEYLAQAYPQYAELLRAAKTRNNAQANRLVQRIRLEGGLKPGAMLAVLGAAYKADIDDARLTPAARFVAAAHEAGYRTTVHDPFVPPGEHEGVTVLGDLAECLKDADAAVILTAHAVHRELPASRWVALMPGRLIVDARRCLDPESLREAGFQVLQLGLGS